MSLIISIETSGNTCGVCLSKGGLLLAEYSIFEVNKHDLLLAELVRRIMSDLQINIVDVAALAVSSGPGSFTGLRIGASFAKGFCFCGEPKLIAVPTLSALATAASKTAISASYTKIISTIPSHKDLLYYQEFDINSEPLSEIVTITKKEFDAMAKAQCFVCGPGYNEKNTTEHFKSIRAEHIAELAFKYFLKNEFTKPDDFVPLYGQDFIPKKSESKN